MISGWGRDGWIATTLLRFVERDQGVRSEGPYEVAIKVKVLQQLWTPAGANGKGEWRDVPTETVKADPCPK